MPIPNPWMNPRYRPYWEWEDYRAGMYRSPRSWMEEQAAARALLADPARLEQAMAAVVEAWPQSAEHQFTNVDQNRRSWAGQAACHHAVGATSPATRAAWAQLTDPQRVEANACADRVIRTWEEAHTACPPLFPGGAQ